MHVSVRATATAVAVAVFTFLFGLVAAPLLSLAPTGAAYAQEGPKIEIELDPVGMVVEGTEIDFTLTFTNVTSTGTTYMVNVVRGGDHDATECESGAAFSQMTDIAAVGGTATATGTISATCPPGHSILVASLYDSGNSEITSTALGFLISGVQSWNLENASTTPYDTSLPTLGSPAGLKGGIGVATYKGDGLIRFHVVDSTNGKIHVYDLEVYTFTFSSDHDDGVKSLAYKESYDIASTTNPWGIGIDVMDGITWVVSNSASTNQVLAYKGHNLSERASSEEFNLASSTDPKGMHFGGGFIIADASADKLLAYERYDGKIERDPTEDYTLNEKNDDPTGIWASGHVIWVADTEDNKLYAYDMYPTKKYIPEWDVTGIADNPAGIWSDYSNMYVLDSSDKTIYAYSLPNKYNARLTVSGPTYVKNPENGTGKVASYSASSPDPLNWSLVSSGDHQHFSINGNGHLYFNSPPDFEDPKDDDGDNVYELVIEVAIPQVQAFQPLKVTHYPVRVEVTDLDHEQPYFPDSRTTRSVEENTAAGTDIGDPVTAVPRDDDTLVYSLGGADAESFDFNTSTAQIITKAALDHEATSTYSVTVSVRDNEDADGKPSIATDDSIQVTIEVTDVDEGPEIDGTSSHNHPENTLQVGQYTATDPNNRAITWSLSGEDANKFSITATGTLSFKSPPDFENPTDQGGNNDYYVIITVTAGTGTESLPVIVFVYNVNEAPTFSSSQVNRSVAENTPAGENIGAPVTASDVDDSDSLYYELGGDDASAFDIDLFSGQIQTSAPLDHETKPSNSVKVIVSDQAGATSSIDVAIAVTDANDPPAFADTSTTRSVVEHTNNAPVGAPITATDQDGDGLHYELTGEATSTFSINPGTGQLTSLVALDSETQDAYSVTVSVRDNKDDEGAADTAEDDSITVSITVTDGNDAPSFPGATTTIDVYENTPAGQAFGEPVSATDPDDTDLIYSVTGKDAGHFDIATSTGQILTKSELDYESVKKSYTVTVQVTDGRNMQGNADTTIDDTIEVTITVLDKNEPPRIIGRDTISWNENATGTVERYSATDPENATTTWSVFGTGFSISEDGVLTINVAPDREVDSVYRIVVQASDGINTTDLDVTINIRNVDEAPVVSGDTSIDFDENATGMVATFTADDPEQDDISWRVSGTDAGFFNIATGTLTFKSPPDYEAQSSYDLTVVATGVRESGTLDVTVNITNVDEDGSVTLSPAQPRVNSSVSATLSDPDTDISDLTWKWETSTSTEWTTVRTATSSDGTVDSYTPDDADEGKSLRVTVSYTDGFGSGKSASTTATVAADSNQPPILSGLRTLTYAENRTDAVAVYTFSDPEGEDVTLEPRGTDGRHFRFQGGQLHFNAQPDFEDPWDAGGDNVYNMTVVADDKNRTTSLDVTVTVTDVNEPPKFPSSDTRIRSVSENTAAGQNVGYPVRANDPENDELAYSLGGTDARHFSIETNTGQILAKSELDYEGRKSYSVRVSVTDNKNADGSSNSAIDDTIDITINVTGEDEAPTIAGATSTSFAENGTRPVATYIGRDPEGGAVTWTVHGTDSAHFAISNGGALSFDPVPDYEDAKDSDNNNVYHVTVRASDVSNFNPLDVTVTVTNVEEAGTVTLSSVQPQVGTPLTATLDDPDEVTSAVTWSWHSSTSRNSGWSTISNETSDTYTPVDGDVGKYLRVTASYTDGFNSNTKTVRAISANAVRAVPVNNNPPNFGSNSQSRSVQENSPRGTNIGGPVTATDAGDTLTYRLNGTDGAMFSIVPSTGQLQTRMPLDYESNTRYTVMVKALDPSSASSTIPVTISVTNVDEPPVVVDDSATASEDGSAVSVDVLANDSDPEGETLTLESVTQPSNGSAVVENGQAKYTPNAGYYGSDRFTYTVSDGTLTSVGNVVVTVASTDDLTIQLAEIPIQFVPIDGGGVRILLSDYFSDPDSGYPPYQSTSSEAAIMTVEVSEGYLSITPVGIGVATTTLTVSDTPGINQRFRVVVYRPVVPRTDTETVHIVDPDVETTLTSSDSNLSVTFQAGARDQFFQVAIDAKSNNCGVEAPVGHQHVCVLVDLFDLAAESIEENLDRPSTMQVTLDQTLYSAIQTAVANGEFTMWKGHGPTDVSWDQIQACPDPRGTDECYELTADGNGNGGKITVYNIMGFSEFAAGNDLPAPTPIDPPTTTPPTDPPVTTPPVDSPTTTPPPGTGGGGTTGGGSDIVGNSQRHNTGYEYTGNQTPQIFGQLEVTYAENDTGPVAEYTARDADGDEITWSLLGYDRRKFEISSDGILSFRSPPDYENPEGRGGNTYWVIIQAEDNGRPSEYDVHNVRVTVTQVNELGNLNGDADLTLPENTIEPIAQYQIEDPENGTITWSLSGPDAEAFQIDEQGNLSPAATLDFESPASSNDSNVHTLTVTATDDGSPELSAQLDVSITLTNVNEAPLVDSIPGVDLSTEELPWLIDLGMYFADPDGDSLTYEISGKSITGVALAHLESGTLSIDPVSEGEITFYVVATDSGGMRAVTSVAVSVTDPEPEPAVTVPEPVAVVPVPTPTVPEPAIVAPEPETYAPLPPLVERRILNQTQESDSVSKLIVGFALEPVPQPAAEVDLPPVERSMVPQKVSPADDASAQSLPPLMASLDTTEGGLANWMIILLVLIAMMPAGYFIRMFVIHRL